MLLVDLYSLVPAFTLTGFLGILLWPENIAYKNRLRLFMVILVLWIAASTAGMAGYSTTAEPLTCFINLIVGCIGFVAVFLTLLARPDRQ